MKRWGIVILCVAMIAALSGCGTKPADVDININQTVVAYEHAPYQKGDVLMVPAEETALAMGAGVVSKDSHHIELSYLFAPTLTFKKGSDKVLVNGGETKSPVKTVKKGGVLYVPFDFLCERWGITVNKKDKVVAVSTTQGLYGATKKSGLTAQLNSQMPADKNYLFSPISIKLALAMTANGATGTTMREILPYLATEDKTASSIAEYNKLFKKQLDGYDKVKHTTLAVADSVWINQNTMDNIDFDKGFAQIVEEYYHATAQRVAGRGPVNRWVKKNTKGKIDEMLDSDEYRAALVNALYFKGQWKDAFDKENNTEQAFTDKNGKKTNMTFMNRTGTYAYYTDNDTAMLGIPYEDNFTMYIALSTDQNVDWTEKLSSMKDTPVTLSLPKFTAECSTSLKDMLANMGIKTMFSAQASFPNMVTSATGFMMDDVLHKTYLEVNEEGSAAAATDADTKTLSPDGDPAVKFTADKPFTYFIYDETNKEVLLMGQYAFAE